MADNVPITAGSGTTIATDEVNTGGGAAHVQLVKLLDVTVETSVMVNGSEFYDEDGTEIADS